MRKKEKNNRNGNTSKADGSHLLPGSPEFTEFILDHVYGLSEKEQDEFLKLQKSEQIDPENLKEMSGESESFEAKLQDLNERNENEHKHIDRYYKAQEGMKTERMKIMLNRAMSEASATPGREDDIYVEKHVAPSLRRQAEDKTIDITELEDDTYEPGF